MPVALSFTVEADGTLPTGEPLKSAIDRVDAVTCFYPLYFMVDCVHALHLRSVFAVHEPWMDRIRGVRANSWTEYPTELAQQWSELKRMLPSLNIVGVGSGTDHQHLEEIARLCSTEHARRVQNTARDGLDGFRAVSSGTAAFRTARCAAGSRVSAVRLARVE